MKIKLPTALCVILMCTSCEKVSLDENIELSSQEKENASITLSTRTGDDNNVTEGFIYIFNSSGACVQRLSTDADNTEVTTKLSAGTYSIYAFGGSDLSRFIFPSQEEATTTSVIARQAGKLMGDLLQKQTDITVEDGEERDLNLTLDRKVLCIDQVIITNMPTDVTKVEVSLSPFYSTMSFDGTYPTSPSESYIVSLTKQTDGTTWKATPNQMLFPSKGTPMVNVSLTSPEGTSGFSYTAETAMLANKHYTISGAYNVAHGATLSCTLSASEWGEDGSIDFELNKDNQLTYAPVAGQKCNGYYCVSVNTTARTAVLLSKKSISYAVPNNTTDATAWQQATIEPMANLEKPTGIEGTWRLPTSAETEIFSKESPLIVIFDDNNNISPIYFCTINSTFGWGYTLKDGNTYTFNTGTTPFGSQIKLRPVIDINY